MIGDYFGYQPSVSLINVVISINTKDVNIIIIHVMANHFFHSQSGLVHSMRDAELTWDSSFQLAVEESAVENIPIVDGQASEDLCFR